MFRGLVFVPVLALVAACGDATLGERYSPLGAQSTVDGNDDLGSAGGGYGAGEVCLTDINLRTHLGSYVGADNGGGATVSAMASTPGGPERFALRDLDCGSLLHGDAVALYASDGHLLTAVGGGGGELRADASYVTAVATFMIERLAGNGVVVAGDAVALQAGSGHYMVAEEGGGHVLNVNRTSIGPWETFILVDAPPAR